MGCSHSTATEHFVINENVAGQDRVAADVFQKLLLSKQTLDTFYRGFCEIDADNSGLIRLDEFRAYFRVENTEFNRRVFTIFDYDNSGCLNFLEFVCAVLIVLIYI